MPRTVNKNKKHSNFYSINIEKSTKFLCKRKSPEPSGVLLILFVHFSSFRLLLIFRDIAMLLIFRDIVL